MTCAITAVDIRKEFAYEALHADNVLVPTRITVRCITPPGTRKVELSPLSLPFGLLERIRIRFADVESTGGDGVPSPSPPSCTATIEVVKMSGRVKSQALHSGHDMCMVLNEAKDNQDAADVDLKAVFRATGHFMNCRMVAAASLIRVLVTFDGSEAVPSTFFLEYDGANVLTRSEAASFGPKYAFQLPPLTARARMARNTKSKED